MTNGQQSGLTSAPVRRSGRCSRPAPWRVPRYCQPNNTRVFDAEYEPMDYDFTDAQGNTLQGTMGDKMSIILLPRAKEEPGTAPGTNQLEPITRYLNANYPQYTWIKGHMW